jgi:hypothetical protein
VDGIEIDRRLGRGEFAVPHAIIAGAAAAAVIAGIAARERIVRVLSCKIGRRDRRLAVQPRLGGGIHALTGIGRIVSVGRSGTGGLDQVGRAAAPGLFADHPILGFLAALAVAAVAARAVATAATASTALGGAAMLGSGFQNGRRWRQKGRNETRIGAAAAGSGTAVRQVADQLGTIVRASRLRGGSQRILAVPTFSASGSSWVSL